MRRFGIVSLVCALVLISRVNAQITIDEASQKQMAMTNLASMPLTFTENHGQWDEKAMFKAEAGGATFWFCGDEIVYVFTRNTVELLEDDRHMMPDKFDKPRYKKESFVIRAQLIGANPDAQIIGENRLSHNCNYFYGNDQSKWHTDVPNYSSITYKDIYPGIDLKYHGNGKGMKYDFIVHPGADISQIQIRYEGADCLAITPNGDLEATTLFGPIHENIPSVYQEIGRGKREVTGRYVITAPGVFGFEVDNYNPSLTLIIDPELIYSTYLGGGNDDWALAIAVDGSGSAYVTGISYSSDFPTVNPYDASLNGVHDVFVTKLSPAGNSLTYSTYLGGSDSESAIGIAVDGSGNAYVIGETFSSDFPTVNPYDGSYNGGAYDAFVTKLSSAGDSLTYSTYLGGDGYDIGWGIAVDSSGSAYVTGYTDATDFPMVNPYDGSSDGDFDAFVTKFSPAGDSLTYSTYLGGSSDNDCGQGIAVDGSGSAYVTGVTWSSDFPTVNPYDGSLNGLRDAFVTKLSPAGNSLTYSTYFGGDDIDEGFAIAVDGSGSAYVTGWTQSNDFPTVNPYNGSFSGIGDVFVTKLSPAGNSLTYSTYLGGSSGPDFGYAIAVDGSGSAYVTGKTRSNDFPTVNPYDGNLDGFSDVFVTMLSPAGNSLTYSTYLGGSSDDEGFSVTVDGSGSAYVTGWTQSSDFPTTPGAYNTTYIANEDVFVAKFVGEPQDSMQVSMWKWDQLPDTTGWNVNATWPKVLADDWLCTQTGHVKDLHFWGSWMHGEAGEIDSFLISFHDDIPAYPHPDSFSKPEMPPLMQFTIPDYMFTSRHIITDTLEGWYDPNEGEYISFDHSDFYAYEIYLPDSFWFWQDSSDIYWLNISAFLDISDYLKKWGWKSSDEQWNDDAVWSDDPLYDWQELYEPPGFDSSLDLSFIITSGEDSSNGSIYGTKFWDLDADCINDFNEPGIGGWEIKILYPNGQTQTIKTAPDGSYWFKNLVPGPYIVSEEHLAGWFQNCPVNGTPHNVMVTAGNSVGPFDFGNAGGWVNQQLYHNTTEQTAYDLVTVLQGEWNVLAAIHMPFPFHSVTYFPPPQDYTVIRWWGAQVDSCTYANGCFTAEYGNIITQAGKAVITSWWSDINGQKTIEVPKVDGNAGWNPDLEGLHIEILHNWINWVGQGWPILPSDGPGEPHGPITLTDLYYAVTDIQRPMEELNDSLFENPSLAWIPLSDTVLNYGEIAPYNLGNLDSSDVVLVRFSISSEGESSDDIIQFVAGLVPLPTNNEYLPGDANMPNGIWPPSVIGADVTYLVNYFRALNGSCLLYGFFASADANGDCLIIGSDVTRLVNYFRGLSDINYCPDYEPAWPTPDDLPPTAPSGWPNCD
ncbi:MAG: hypothetical protein GY839_19800 [candidate division Zixibacteria bacterium]|nr:hypothetical protein [candidate division Zixibacteria bacterium]